MKKNQLKNRLVRAVVLSSLVLLTVTLCGGCVTYLGSSNYTNVDHNEGEFLSEQHTFSNGKYYTDKLRPNEKQLEKAYGLQTYLIDSVFNEGGLFYKDENVNCLEFLSYSNNGRPMSSIYYDLTSASDEDFKFCRENIFNAVTFILEYDAGDTKAIENIALFREHVDKNFFTGFTNLTDSKLYPVDERQTSQSAESYEHNMQIIYSVSYDTYEKKTVERFTFGYFQTFEYARGYEELTDELAKHKFIFSDMSIDNQIQKLCFQNTSDMDDIERSAFPMKIVFFLQDNKLNKIKIIKHPGEMPSQNTSALAYALKSIGASQSETDSILSKINSGTLSTAGTKEGSINISRQLSNGNLVCLEFWKD